MALKLFRWWAVGLVMASALLVSLFGQYLIGAYSIFSIKAIVSILEVVIVLLWLARGPGFQAWRALPFFAKAALGGWFFWGVISTLLAAHNVPVAIVGQAEWCLHMLLIAALVDWFGQGRERILADAYVGALCLAGLWVLIYFAWRWINMESPRQYNWFWGALPFLHIRHFSFLFLSAYIASLLLWNKSLWFSVLTLLFVGALMWAGGRGALGAAALISVAWGVFQVREKRNWSWIGLLVVVWFLAWPFSEALWVEHPGLGISLLHGRSEDISLDIISSGRLSIWTSVFEQLQGWRLWVGLGTNNYMFMPGRADETVHPHSFYVQAVGDWGVVGAGCLLVVIFSVLLAVTKRNRLWLRSNNVAGEAFFVILLLLTGQLILGGVDGNFYHSWSLMMLCPAFSLLILALVVDQRLNEISSWSLGKRWVFPAALLVLLSVVQLLNVCSVFSREVPTPDSWRARLVMSFPYNAQTVDKWFPVWMESSPADADRLLRWLQVNSPVGHQFYFLEAKIRRDSNNEPEKVRALIDAAIAVAPKRARKAILEETADW